MAEAKLDLVAACQQMLTILTPKGGEQTVFRDELQRL